jgi:hypothetical protein
MTSCSLLFSLSNSEKAGSKLSAKITIALLQFPKVPEYENLQCSSCLHQKLRNRLRAVEVFVKWRRTLLKW